MDTNPEIGLSIDVGGITTNYHRAGSGPVVLLVHGSGPGVSAWANWRLTIPALAEHLTVIAPDIVGNSFGGALALSMAAHQPERVERLVLMGAAGVPFPITDGLDRVWGYEPSLETMRGLLDVFAHDPAFTTDELATLRYEASV